MFKRIAQFTDLHIGKKNNSDVHNQDCMDYIDWFIAEAKKFNADVIVCCGDFHDVRASINIKTMNYSIRALEKLSEAFPKTYMVLGNHDLYHKERLDIHSLKYGNHIKNVEIIDKITTVDDVTFVPWLVGDAWKKLAEIKSKYVFAHLELPHFYTNSLMQYPDHGTLSAENFTGPEYVFTGHFHKRQFYKNKNGTEIIYTGNAFPHNFSDTNDFERGCMLLEHGQKPVFVNWGEAPTYKVTSLSEVLEKPEEWLTPKSHLRIDVDIELGYDEINFIRDVLLHQFGSREILFPPKKSDDLMQEYSGESIEFKSVDNLVISHIESMETESFDKKLLTSIYSGL